MTRGLQLTLAFPKLSQFGESIFGAALPVATFPNGVRAAVAVVRQSLAQYRRLLPFWDWERGQTRFRCGQLCLFRLVQAVYTLPNDFSP